MQVTMETFGKVLVAHTPDDLNEETSRTFLDALARPIEEGQVRIVLAMDRTETYDSAGLTALLDLQDQLREQGGQLRISGLGDPGRKIFEMTRLDRRFDAFDSVIDAVDSFR